MRPATLLLVTATALSACACSSSPIEDDKPARIVDATAASRDELKRVVSEALDAPDVVLADDALTDSSRLVVERSRVRSIDNAPLAGRDLGVPEHFQLILHGGHCLLIHERTARRFSLDDATCVPE